MSYETLNKKVFIQSARMFEEATEQGSEAVFNYLKACAYVLGAQAAVVSKPQDVPKLIDILASEMGRGIQDALYKLHGIKGSMSVQVFEVRRSK